MNTPQRQAHLRLMSTLPVRTHTQMEPVKASRAELLGSNRFVTKHKQRPMTVVPKRANKGGGARHK